MSQLLRRQRQRMKLRMRAVMTKIKSQPLRAMVAMVVPRPNMMMRKRHQATSPKERCSSTKTVRMTSLKRRSFSRMT